jgi:xylulokinase
VTRPVPRSHAGPYLIGVDVGSYSAKGVLVTLDGCVVATATVEYGITFPQPGWAEHDADRIWWDSLVHIVRTLLHESGIDATSVAAVGCSAIGITMLPVDSRGKPLRPSILYGIDTRAHREIDELHDTLGEDRIVAVSGSPLSSSSVGPKILWLRRNEPDTFGRTHQILTASAYLAFRLTGEYSIDAYSAQGFAPLFDPDTRRWIPGACEHVCPEELLPPILGTTDIVGTVHGPAAAETGLPVGTPVIAGTVDAAAEAISVGVTAPGETMLMLGTTAFITQVLGKPLQHQGLFASRFLVEGTYALSAGLATSAALTRWFRDNFAAAEVRAEEAGGDNAYQSLAAQAGRIPPGSEGLIALPYFSGERAPIQDPRARGVIAGLTLSHTRAHVYRALLEGVAYSIRHNLDVMAGLGAPPRSLTAVGGGTKNPLWLEIIADCTRTPVAVPDQAIGASYGDAYLAGVGIGRFDGFDTLRTQWVRHDRAVEPDLERHAVYEAHYEVYLRCYPSLRRELHALADLQGRAAPH